MHIRHAASFLVILAASQALGADPGLIEYRNATWWDGRSEFTGSRYVRGDRFADIESASAEMIIDLHGAIVTAPFGEGHNHNVVRPIFDHANQEYLSNGVFYAKIPGIHPPEVEPIRDLLARADTVDAAFSLGMITSPGGHPVGIYVGFLSDLLYGGATYEDFSGLAFHEVASEADVNAAIGALASQGADFVKTVLVYSERFDDGFQEGLNPDLLPFLVRRSHDIGLTVSLHVESAEDFRRGVAAGVDEIAHLPGFVWGKEEKAADHILTENDARRAAESDVAVVTTTNYANVIGKRFGFPEDALTQFKTVQRQNLRLLIDADVEIRIGSDVYDRTGGGEGANPTRGEVENLVTLGVFDAEKALSVWIDTGRKIFPQRRIACFEAGCEASFLVFDADPRIDLGNLDQLTLAIKQGVDVTKRRDNKGILE